MYINKLFVNTTIAIFFSFLPVVLSFSVPPLSHDVAKSRKWKWDGEFVHQKKRGLVAWDVVQCLVLGVQSMREGKARKELNNRKKTTLLFVTFGHSQLKSKPSENHSTKSISFRLYSISFLPAPSNPIQTGRALLVLSMTDLFLILVHFPLALVYRIQFDGKAE